MRKRHRWTPDEFDTLRKLYPDMRTADIAARMNMTISQVRWQAANLRLKKSKAFRAGPDSHLFRPGHHGGEAYQFRPGHQTWNKGLKGLNLGGHTRFKPGALPHNAVPVGTIVMAKDGYLKIKIAEPRQWKQLHHKNWEEVNGPVPEGMILVFRDRDRENCAPENLELITKKENIERNTVHNLPPEIREVVQIRAGLVRRINRKEKNSGK